MYQHMKSSMPVHLKQFTESTSEYMTVKVLNVKHTLNDPKSFISYKPQKSCPFKAEQDSKTKHSRERLNLARHNSGNPMQCPQMCRSEPIHSMVQILTSNVLLLGYLRLGIKPWQSFDLTGRML